MTKQIKELTKEIRTVTNLTGEKVQLTKEGQKEYQERLDELVNVLRPEVAIELKEARAQGDLSENADYDAAKNKQAEIEAEIAKIEDILSRAQIISEKLTKAIRVGSKFKYLKDNKEYEAFIVGPVEANPNEEIPKVASDTPFAKAVIGLAEDEEVRIKATNKSYKIKILEIFQ